MPNLMMSWPHAAILVAVCAVAGIGLRMVGPRKVGPRKVGAGWARVASAFAIEAGIVAALYTVWQLAGDLSIMGTSEATARADSIARFEHAVRLPSERSVQDLIIHHPLAVQGANLYYASMHFGVLFIFLLWLFTRHRDQYSPVRTTLAISTLVCLAISFVPVAPPRLLNGITGNGIRGNGITGIVDTAARYGQSVYSGGITADQLAAMPSVHVLWAVTIAWYAVKIGRSAWRFLGPVHAGLTIFVVVATGNHWWLDGVVAVVVLVACAWARYGVALAWRAWRWEAEAATAVGAGEPTPVVVS